MTDLINTSIVNRAQNYQDNVMNKLLNSRSSIQHFDSNAEANSGQRLHKLLQEEKENQNQERNYLTLAQQLAKQSQKRIRSPLLRGDEVEGAFSAERIQHNRQPSPSTRPLRINVAQQQYSPIKNQSSNNKSVLTPSETISKAHITHVSTVR